MKIFFSFICKNNKIYIDVNYDKIFNLDLLIMYKFSKYNFLFFYFFFTSLLVELLKKNCV